MLKSTLSFVRTEEIGVCTLVGGTQCQQRTKLGIVVVVVVIVVVVVVVGIAVDIHSRSDRFRMQFSGHNIKGTRHRRTGEPRLECVALLVAPQLGGGHARLQLRVGERKKGQIAALQEGLVGEDAAAIRHDGRVVHGAHAHQRVDQIGQVVGLSEHGQGGARELGVNATRIGEQLGVELRRRHLGVGVGAQQFAKHRHRFAKVGVVVGGAERGVRAAQHGVQSGVAGGAVVQHSIRVAVNHAVNHAIHQSTGEHVVGTRRIDEHRFRLSATMITESSLESGDDSHYKDVLSSDSQAGGHARLDLPSGHGGGVRRWWHRSLAHDWLLLVALFAGTAAITETGAIAPFQRFVIQDDPATSYPNDPDIVPNWALIVIILSVPIAVFFILQLAPFRSWLRLHDLHNACLGLLSALTWTFVLTAIGKLYCGRLRPDYEARVDDMDRVVDAMQSFPSGHSSMSFASMTFLALYLSGKLGVFHADGGHVVRFALAVWPWFVSSLIAMSRTRDYHHNFSDILAGTVIGIGFGTLSHGLYFHPVSSPSSALPKQRKTSF
jgi:diacylglycerol diphosphate phosphatase/phosphatidate phosphatase